MKPCKEVARRRLLKDFKTHIDQPDPSFICSPIENDIMKWIVVIFGYYLVLSDHCLKMEYLSLP